LSMLIGGVVVQHKPHNSQAVGSRPRCFVFMGFVTVY
jgi:hypothetical protein